jgi:hypothetical protein
MLLLLLLIATVRQSSSQPADTTPPVLTSLAVTPSAVDVSTGSATVTFDYSATDDLSGVTAFSVALQAPGQGFCLAHFETFAATLSRTGSLSVTIPQYGPAGTWTICEVVVEDAANNAQRYATADLANLGFPASLTVVSNPSDSTPPQLTSLAVTPSAVDVGTGPATVTFDYSATDDLSGVTAFSVALQAPGQGFCLAHFETFAATLSRTGSLSVMIPQDAPVGSWTICSAEVDDGVGNQARYQTTDLANLGFPTSFIVTRTTPCGDVNGDGVVNIGDALIVAQFDVGLRQCGVAPFSHPDVCDVNGDGACNIGDALRIAQCDVGLISCAFTCRPFTCPTTTTTTTSSTTTTTLRFMDNGDGTVTDQQTGLQWEKKVPGVCSGNSRIACLSDGDCFQNGGTCVGGPHYVNSKYTWSSSGSAPDGTTFTTFLANLNGGATGVGNCVSDGSTQMGGFNNHCDWRLPTIDELRTIFGPCSSGACIDPIFGPTAVSEYWASTTDSRFSSLAWFDNFAPGGPSSGTDSKGGSRFVRAVRGPRAAASTPRFVDNGDGTVTDHQTGLMWEKKVASVCSGALVLCTSDADCVGFGGTCQSCLHCVNDTYTWSSSTSGTAPDGTAFTNFLNTSNGGATGVGNCVSDGSTQMGGFNNHCDWRLPTVAELKTIADPSAPGCSASSPCINPVFGVTADSPYWSSTTDSSLPNEAWFEEYPNNGFLSSENKGFNNSVRAVRGGS